MEDYIFALVGTLPLTIFTVVLGATAENLLVPQDMTVDEYAIRRVAIVSGLLLVMVAVIMTLYKAKKELVREIEAERLAENVEKALGRESPLVSGNGSGDGPGSMNQPQDDLEDQQGQVEVRLREGVDDEEWFWFYS
jgi:hypothetical protein